MESSKRPAPALSLSLSLAGPFGRNEPPAAEGGDEGGGGIRLSGGLRPGEAVDISSDNNMEQGGNKRRKSHHRPTAEETEVLKAAFKESPHPDETKRQQLSEQLGLSENQVKYWFQIRRFETKVIQDRHENSLLKSQLEKLQEQNRAMNTEGQLLRLENTKLKTEIERLRRALGNNAATGFLASPSCSRGGIHISRNSLDDYVDVGRDNRTRFLLELAGRALDELMAMCSSGEPLWVRSAETARDVLNYDEYARLFRLHDGDSGDRRAVWSVEASRETTTGLVCIEATKLVDAFVDVNQWKEMFPSMITKALTREVIHAGGEHDHRDGVVQVMSAEVQTLTPLVPTRELHFLRHCRKLGPETWAIVDVSLDNFEQPGAQTSWRPSVCLKKPSGCIVEQQSCGRCKVTWVEHVKCRNDAVPSSYQTVTASGLAFGARRWVAALRLQCERMVFSVAINVPTRGLNGIATLPGRQSVLKLAQRMTSSLYRVIGASRDLAWRRKAFGGARDGDTRVMSRKSTGGEPQGLIVCAVLSVRLPVSPAALFGFLLDESRRHEWDLMLTRQPGQPSYVTVRKGDDNGNCVTVYAASTEELRGKWILQDSSPSPVESTLAYAPVDAEVLQPVIYGDDSSFVVVLPCGFVVMPDADGMEVRPAAIASRKGKEAARPAVESPGSLFTLVFQALATETDDAARFPQDARKAVTNLAHCTLGNIQKALRCGD